MKKQLTTETPNYYAILPANVRYDQNLCAGAKLLYAEITALAQKNGKCWATNNYFADLYGVQIRSIQRWISELESANHIAVDVRKSEANRRYIVVDIAAIIKTKNEINSLPPLCQKRHKAYDKKDISLMTKKTPPLCHFCPAPINRNNITSINITRERARDFLQIKDYFEEKKFSSNAQHFFDHYQDKGWGKMDWRKRADIWEQRELKMYPAKTKKIAATNCAVCGAAGIKYQMDKNNQRRYLCNDCLDKSPNNFGELDITKLKQTIERGKAV